MFVFQIVAVLVIMLVVLATYQRRWEIYHQWYYRRQYKQAVRLTSNRIMRRGWCHAAHPDLKAIPCLEGGKLCTFLGGLPRCKSYAPIDLRIRWKLFGKRPEWIA